MCYANTFHNSWLVNVFIFCSVLHLQKKKTEMGIGLWGMSDGPSQPTSAGMLQAPRLLLWRYWLSSGESGSVLILMTAEETAAHLCGPPDTWSRGEMRSKQPLWRREGKGKGNTWISLRPAFGLRFVCCFPSAVFSAVEETLELISHQLRKNKKTTHCWLALCCALGLSRHRSGALDGNIENTGYSFENYDD